MGNIPVLFVRNRYFEPVAILEHYQLKYTDIYNGVGKWELTIPGEFPQAKKLDEPGTGIVVEYQGIILSGRKTRGKLKQTTADPVGMWKFEGVTDNEYLQHKRIYPNPALPVDQQDRSHYVDSGSFETVAKQLVYLNAGGGALAKRQQIEVSPDLGRGNNVSVNERFSNLLEVLNERAILGGLGFRVEFKDNQLVFDVFEPRDRSYIQLDVQTDTAKEAEWASESPMVSEPIVMGQGEAAERVIRGFTTPESEAASDSWGVWIEDVFDRRDAEEESELEATGLTALAEGGTEIFAYDVEPGQVLMNRIGSGLWLGDIVTAVASDKVFQAQLTEVTISIGHDGIILAGSVGNPTLISPARKSASSARKNEQRLSFLEREAESSGAGFLIFETKAELDSSVGRPGWKATVWGDPTAAHNGDYEWDGVAAAWLRPYPRIATGQVRVSTSTTGNVSPIYWADWITVTYPVTVNFTVRPRIFVSSESPSGRVDSAFQIAEGTSTTAFQVRPTRVSSGFDQPIGFNWMAIQETP